MKKVSFILLISVLNLNIGFAQTESEIDSLLNEIGKTKNSKEIIKTKQAEKLIAFGEKSLLSLTDFFTDTTLTKVKSECHNRNLTKGEIAIIIADKIEKMPYFQVTRIQNCTIAFCDDNPNNIEYYFGINNFLNNIEFKEKYVEWLFSKDRLKRTKGMERKERKRIIDEWKNTSR